MTKENSYLQQAEDKTAKRPCFAWQQKSRLSQRSILNVRVSNNFSDIVGKGPGKAVWRDTAAKMSLIVDIRELKHLRRRRPQRRVQKTIGLINDQNNNFARVSCFSVHFFDVHCTTTTWHFLICRFMEHTTRSFFLSLKERKFIFLATFSLPSSSSLLKVPIVSICSENCFIDSYWNPE